MSSGWVIVHWSGGAVADINFTFYATKDSSLEHKILQLPAASLKTQTKHIWSVNQKIVYWLKTWMPTFLNLHNGSVLPQIWAT